MSTCFIMYSIVIYRIGREQHCSASVCVFRCRLWNVLEHHSFLSSRVGVKYRNSGKNETRHTRRHWQQKWQTVLRCYPRHEVSWYGYCRYKCIFFDLIARKLHILKCVIRYSCNDYSYYLLCWYSMLLVIVSFTISSSYLSLWKVRKYLSRNITRISTISRSFNKIN